MSDYVYKDFVNSDNKKQFEKSGEALASYTTISDEIRGLDEGS